MQVKSIKIIILVVKIDFFIDKSFFFDLGSRASKVFVKGEIYRSGIVCEWNIYL